MPPGIYIRTASMKNSKGHKRAPFSNEWKKKISLGHLGKKRLPFTKETKEKMSKAQTGKKHSGETKLKISKVKTGTKWGFHTEESKRKISEAHMGKVQLWFRGAGNPRWKGGITSLVQQIRHCFKYRQWRSDVFTRDNYTCQMCGKRNGGIIHADHYPKDFSDIFHENKIVSLEQAIECEEFWNLNNGRTLCLPCHRTTDSWGAKGKKKRYRFS